MPLSYKTKTGLYFYIWELSPKQFSRAVAGIAALVGDWKTVHNHKTHLGLCRQGTEPTWEIFLRKPYTLSCLTHEVYHAVHNSASIAKDEELQARTIGDVVQAAWKEGNQGKGKT